MAKLQLLHGDETARQSSTRVLLDGEIFITKYTDNDNNEQRVFYVGDGSTQLKDLKPQTVTPEILAKAVKVMTETENGIGHPDNRTIELGVNGELSASVIKVVDELPNPETDDVSSDILYLLIDEDENCTPYVLVGDVMKPFKIEVTIPTMTDTKLGVGKPDGVSTEVDENGVFSAKVFKVVETLPTAENANEDVIYLWKNTNDRYEQYHLIEGALVRINESLTANRVFLVVSRLPAIEDALLDVIYFVKDDDGNCTSYTLIDNEFKVLTSNQVYGIMSTTENGVGRPDGETIEVDTDGIFTANVLRVVDTLPEDADAIEGVGYLKADNEGNYSMYALINGEVKSVGGSGGSGGISFVLDTESEEVLLKFETDDTTGDNVLSAVVKTIQTSKLRDGGKKLIIDANPVDQDDLTHADEVAGNVINGRFKARRGTEQTFTTKNPIFLDGELVIIKDKGQYVVGDGVTAFTDLTRYSLAGTDYSAGDGIIIAADNKISVDTPIFTGVHSVWEAFTDDEKAVYKIVNFTDGDRGTYSYNSTTQELTLIAGKSDIQYGATASRKGDITGNIPANSSIRVIVTFDESMPDENYILAVEPDMIAISWAIINKDADGFVLIVTNTNESELGVKFNWNAFKLFEVAVISDLQDDIDSKADANDVYTKTEIDQKLQEIRDLIS